MKPPGILQCLVVFLLAWLGQVHGEGFRSWESPEGCSENSCQGLCGNCAYPTTHLAFRPEEVSFMISCSPLSSSL